MGNAGFCILYPDARFADHGRIERSMLAGRLDVELCIFLERPDGFCPVPPETFARCDAMVVYHKLRVDATLLNHAPRCRLVVRAGVGLNNIDLSACAVRGVPVCNVPDYGTHEVADHAIALMLTLVRGTASYNERLRAHPQKGWQFEGIAPVRRIFGAVLGVAGLGRIGTAVAERAASFGMKIIYFGGKGNGKYERVDTMAELLTRSDVLSLHLPLTDATRRVIDRNAISIARPGLILVNTARGQLVDTAAVCEGLRSGRLAAVGLDVLPTEPPDEADPLISSWRSNEEWVRGRVVLTPHAAFFSDAGFAELRRISLDIALLFLHDGQLINCVNERELKALRME